MYAMMNSIDRTIPRARGGEELIVHVEMLDRNLVVLLAFLAFTEKLLCAELDPCTRSAPRFEKIHDPPDRVQERDIKSLCGEILIGR